MWGILLLTLKDHQGKQKLELELEQFAKPLNSYLLIVYNLVRKVEFPMMKQIDKYIKLTSIQYKQCLKRV